MTVITVLPELLCKKVLCPNCPYCSSLTLWHTETGHSETRKDHLLPPLPLLSIEFLSFFWNLESFLSRPPPLSSLCLITHPGLEQYVLTCLCSSVRRQRWLKKKNSPVRMCNPTLQVSHTPPTPPFPPVAHSPFYQCFFGCWRMEKAKAIGLLLFVSSRGAPSKERLWELPHEKGGYHCLLIPWHITSSCLQISEWDTHRKVSPYNFPELQVHTLMKQKMMVTKRRLAHCCLHSPSSTTRTHMRSHRCSSQSKMVVRPSRERSWQLAVTSTFRRRMSPHRSTSWSIKGMRTWRNYWLQFDVTLIFRQLFELFEGWPGPHRSIWTKKGMR